MLSFKASAPGSLMLMGEHAVLQGHPALVAAIDKRITVELTPRNDQVVEIISALGKYETTLPSLEAVSPFTFVLATLKRFQHQLKQGCTLSIQSEFSHQVGFASSAAVTVATLMVVCQWLGHDYSSTQLILAGRNIIQDVQGMGSGADVAACVLGGIVAYRMQPFDIETVAEVLPLTVVYSGYKTPTKEVVRKVNEMFVDNHDHLKMLLKKIGECSKQSIQYLKEKNDKSFGESMLKQQSLMHELGVSTPLLNAIVDELCDHPSIMGAKISGSGLGDCIVALGKIEDFNSRYADQGVVTIAVSMSRVGALHETANEFLMKSPQQLYQLGLTQNKVRK